jgi:hypothetical protein
MMDSEASRIKQIRLTSILTVTCGAVASGGLVKFAFDAMPPDPGPNANRDTDSDSKKAQTSIDALKTAQLPGEIAAAEKVVVLQEMSSLKSTIPTQPTTQAIKKPATTQTPQTKTRAKAQVKLASLQKPQLLSKALPIIEPPPQTSLKLPPKLRLSAPRVQPRTVALPETPSLTSSNMVSARLTPSTVTLSNLSSDAPDLTAQLNDIRGHWAQYFIQTLADRQIVRGYGNGRFRPDAPIKVAEFTSLLQQAFPNTTPPISFRDLQASVKHNAPTRAEAAMFVHQTLVKSEIVMTVTDLKIRGAVTRPGRYSLAGLSEQDPRLSKLPTIARAIEYAGGIRPGADLGRVQIRRTTETGQKHTIMVNLNNPDQDVVLQQGDEVTIPSTSAAQSQPRQARTLNRLDGSTRR